MSRTISRRRSAAARVAVGERNNNPGNIRFLAAKAWNGQLPEPGEGELVSGKVCELGAFAPMQIFLCP